MSEEKPRFYEKHLNRIKLIATTILALIALWGAFSTFESRYAKTADVDSSIVDAKKEILSSIVVNRSVMIKNLKRSLRDVNWEIESLSRIGKPVPRYLLDKRDTLKDDIEDMQRLTESQ